MNWCRIACSGNWNGSLCMHTCRHEGIIWDNAYSRVLWKML